jgi:hypothetical protein
MEAERQAQSSEAHGVWKRGLFMLLLAIAFGIGQFVLNLVAVVQFLWLLFSYAQSSAAPLWPVPVGLVCRHCTVHELRHR